LETERNSDKGLAAAKLVSGFIANRGHRKNGWNKQH
jgi:hypothetical protein